MIVFKNHVALPVIDSVLREVYATSNPEFTFDPSLFDLPNLN